MRAIELLTRSCLGRYCPLVQMGSGCTSVDVIEFDHGQVIECRCFGEIDCRFCI
jgi:hypothetical protein